MPVIQWATVVAFVLLGILAVRLWARQRTVAASWLATAFGLFGLALLVGAVLPEDAPPAVAMSTTALTAVAVLAFPYLLFRFAASFRRVPAPVRRAADVAAAAIVVITLALIPYFVPAEDEPAWFSWLLLAIVVYWSVLALGVAVRLWVAGTGRTTVARRRMRALGLSSGALNLAILVSVLGPDHAQTTDAARLTAIAAAAGFYLAFSPPGVLRREWRRADERALRNAPLDVLRAEDRGEATANLLPGIAGLFGAGKAAFLATDGRPIAAFGMDADDLRDATEHLVRLPEPYAVRQRGDWIGMRLSTGLLGVRADPFAPFFGSEEMELFASVGTFIDLALERVDLLAGEREAKARTEAASREIEALLYGISHDLRNPLVSVLGYLDVLEEDVADKLDDDARHYIDRLRANAGYMDALIGDLLELSRIGRTQRDSEPVALDEVVGELAAELRRKHPSASVEVGALPLVEMNDVRARQLFGNLIGNALVHGGRDDLTVTVEHRRSSATHAEMVVADDGKGIPEAYRTRVFRIFEQLESDRSGTGIGLAMCQRIVEQAGGRIWIGDPPLGTAVHVELPLATPRAETEVER